MFQTAIRYSDAMTQTEERAVDVVDTIEFDDTLPATEREAGFYKAGYHDALEDAKCRLADMQDRPLY